ncbi:hypothetical protein NTE17_003453 [Vibrio fluvialis]|nr:hypothetical protein [Vibrio fluvialis]
MEASALVAKLNNAFSITSISVTIECMEDFEGNCMPNPGEVWNIGNRFTIYEGDGVWLSNLYLEYTGETADIKLDIRSPDGSRVTGLHDIRTKVTNSKERLTFSMEMFVSSIVVYCENHNSDEKPIEMSMVKIEGFYLDKLSKNIIEGQNILRSYNKQKHKILSELNFELDLLNEKISSKKNEIEDLEGNLQSKLNVIEKLNETESVVSNQISNLTKSLTQTEKRLQEATKTNDEINSSTLKLKKDINSLKENKVKLSGEVDAVINDVNICKSELKRYEADLALYSEDFSMYKDNVFKNNFLYMLLLFLVLFIGIIVVFNIYNTSQTLIIGYDKGSVSSLWELLISRLPVIFINVLIVSSFLAIFHVLLNQIFENNKKVSKVYQISYLAKEVSSSQGEGLSKLEQKDIFESRVKCKMSLIKELLEENSKSASEDNSYKTIEKILEVASKLNPKQ